MPSKADSARQADFLTNVLRPAMKRAKDGLMELFFADASHFVMGGTPGKLWSKVRRWVRTGSGRKRFNVLGAINFASRKMETVTNDTYITATQVVQLLKEVADLYVGRPIAMVMDNATYQKCK